MNTVDELIRLHAKQLKIPSFAEYHEVLRQADQLLPDSQIFFWNL